MKRAVRFLLIATFCLYCGTVAVRYYHDHHPDPKDNPCSCDDCDCLPPQPQQGDRI